MRPRLIRHLSALTVLVIAGLVGNRTATAGYDRYLALGDSLAFGETDFLHNPSNGDRGYVSLYATSLASRNGGVAPTVINLAADGETTETFLNYDGPTNVGSAGQPAHDWNTNYQGPSTSTQNQRMLDVIGESRIAGESIGVVTIQLGANDLLQLAADPAFLAQGRSDQFAAVANLLNGTVAPNLGTIVGEIQALLPTAQITMLGYYDPYAAFLDSTDPALEALAEVSGLAIAALNQTIEAVALATQVRYVEIASRFPKSALGDLTHVLEEPPSFLPGPNIHPTEAGYVAIAGQPEAVPEPASLVFVGLGATVGLVGAARRRRRALRIEESAETVGSGEVHGREPGQGR